MSDRLNTIERARGRWREILPQLGLETRFLQKKHGPCPLCGGKDRYRFDDKNGSGSYFCNQCGPGVGIVLVRKLNNWDHKTACDAIDRILGDTKAMAIATPKAKTETNKLAPIERLLAEASDHTVVAAYLRKRGLRDSTTVLRGHSRCPYFDDAGNLIGRFPAVVAPVTGADGSLETAMRIYGADVDPRKKIMTPVRTIIGAAVRLHQAADILGVSEGIETGLAAHEMFGVPVWAALTENGVTTFEPPAGIKRLIIFGDNDGNFVGQAAAYSLAKRLHNKSRGSIAIEVRIPSGTDTDWLDVLNSKNMVAA